MRFQRALVLINPHSGRGKGESLGADAARLLAESGITVRSVLLESGTRTTDTIRSEIAAGCDLVVVVGGDGTLRACLDALHGSGVPVLLLPGGTSNLIATHLRLPRSAKAVIRLLTDGDVRKLDVCWLDDEPFVLAAGFGLATDVITDADQELKRYLGPIAYCWSLLRNLARRRVLVEMKLEDGRTVRHRAKLVLFTNCAETLAQVDIVPNSEIDDGLVDVAVFSFANVWQFLRLIGFAITARWRRAREAVFYRSKRVEIWLRPPMQIQIDGDVFPARSYLQVKVEPEGLWMVVPKPRAPIIPREWITEAERRLEILRTGSHQTPAEIFRALREDAARSKREREERRAVESGVDSGEDQT